MDFLLLIFVAYFYRLVPIDDRKLFLLKKHKLKGFI
jgi:hypothetical protein